MAMKSKDQRRIFELLGELENKEDKIKLKLKKVDDLSRKVGELRDKLEKKRLQSKSEELSTNLYELRAQKEEMDKLYQELEDSMLFMIINSDDAERQLNDEAQLKELSVYEIAELQMKMLILPKRVQQGFNKMLQLEQLRKKNDFFTKLVEKALAACVEGIKAKDVKMEKEKEMSPALSFTITYEPSEEEKNQKSAVGKAKEKCKPSAASQAQGSVKHHRRKHRKGKAH